MTAHSDIAAADQAQVDFLGALQIARASGNATVESLQGALKLDGSQLVDRLGAVFKLRVLNHDHLEEVVADFTRLSLKTCIERRVVLFFEDGQLYCVCTDPFDLDLKPFVEAIFQCSISIALASPENVLACLSRFDTDTRAVDAVVAEVQDGTPLANSGIEEISLAAVNDAHSAAVRILTSTLYDALKFGASDIHLECIATGLAIKFRIDGVLDPAKTITGSRLAEQVVSRLKVLAELDIAERRVPQDGSFRITSGGRQIDLRVSIMPSHHGEDAVIRVLDKKSMLDSAGLLSMSTLGFDPADIDALRQLALAPYGMLLVTGPTGSGKTTTLYAALSEINDGRDKIITIEDPIEYQLNGVLQIPVNDKKGLTFARGLRSILRHDPDKIMVGEIRDRETAEIAIQSALTGHLVLTTVHANSSFDVFSRFTHMGVDIYAFLSALNGISAQRLIRLICVHCADAYVPTDADRQAWPGISFAGATLRHGKGCPQCRQTGFKGRRSIAEVLVMTDALRELILNKSSLTAIKTLARSSGTRSLREAAVALACAGHTTLSEVKRVTMAD
ncbi:GspE/PulE family protein [Caballeronia sordidicola]|uniref:Putative secretion system X protein GspE n=1 Tax=Caballeronia sordidicola TaxID=196367 RepID=A0A226WUA8_CABSO|nr:GspE/PulE family protein [Caballeronia sordidicola]OXC74357.1 putative secretion system X protein GspE [Caballeronia sordidicola]